MTSTDNKYMGFSLGFVDDAGDPGFKFERGSSPYFVIACVVFDTPQAAEEASATLRQLRQDFGWNQKHEFKFNKLRKKDIIQTLEAMASHDFRIRAAIVDDNRLKEKRPCAAGRPCGWLTVPLHTDRQDRCADIP